MSPIVIDLVLQGMAGITTGFRTASKEGEATGGAIEKGVKRGGDSLDRLIKDVERTGTGFQKLEKQGETTGKVLAVIFDPAIEKLKEYQSLLKSVGKAPSQPRGLRDVKAPQAPASPDLKSVSDSGISSKWSPQIANVKAYEKAVREAAEESKRAAKEEADAIKAVADAQKKADQDAINSAKQVAKEKEQAAREAADAEKKAIKDASDQAVKFGNAQKWTPGMAGARSAQNARYDSVLSVTGKYLPAEGEGRLNGLAQRYQNISQAVDARSGGVNELGGAIQSGSMGFLGFGAAGAFGLKKSFDAAGEMEGYRNAFRRELGEEAGDAKLAEIVQFAKNSPSDVQGAVKNSQLLMATGFSPDDIIPTLKAIGNAAAATGQGSNSELLGRLATNLAQIRDMEHPQERDLKQFAYAGIDIKDVIGKAVGHAVTEDDLKKMSGKDFVSNFTKGSNIKYAGASDAQVNTLPGQISMLDDSLFQLGAVIGNGLIPVAKQAVGLVTSLSDAFQALPAPFQYLISYTGAAVIGLALLVGGLGSVVGWIIQGRDSLLKLTELLFGKAEAEGAEALATEAAGTAAGEAAVETGFFATSIMGVAIPAMAAFIIEAGLLAAAVWGIKTAFQGTAAASRESASELIYHWGAIAKFWVAAGDVLSKIYDHPLLRLLLDPWNLTGGGDTNKAKGDSDEEKSKAMSDALERKHGRKVGPSQAGHENDDEYSESDADIKKREEAPKSVTPTPLPPLTSIMPVMPPHMVPGIPSSQGVSVPSPMSQPVELTNAVPAASSYEGEKESLQDQIYASNDKDQKKELRHELQLASRAERHDKERQRQAKDALSDREKRVREDMYLNLTSAENPADQAALDAAYKRKATHNAPRDAMRANSQAEKEQKAMMKRQMALQLSPLEDIVHDPSASKYDKQDAQRKIFEIHKGARLSAMGFDSATVSAMTEAGRRGSSFLDRLRGGGSLFDRLPSMNDAGPLHTIGSDSGANEGGGGAGGRRVLYAEVQSQRTLPDMSVEIIFKPLIVKNQLANQLGAALGG